MIVKLKTGAKTNREIIKIVVRMSNITSPISRTLDQY